MGQRTSERRHTNSDDAAFTLFYRGGWAYLTVSPPTGAGRHVYPEDVENRMKLLGIPKVDRSRIREIDQHGDMYVLTYSGPRPLAEDFDSGEIEYAGGHLIRHNIYSGETEDLGVPVEGETWCYSAYSGQHGLLFAVGQAKNTVMAYDVRERRVLYAGHPPPGIRWWMRCILIEPDTGGVFSSNTADRGQGVPFVRWTRRYNTFKSLDIQTPANPITGVPEALRAHTQSKDSSGRYWCFDEFGYVFTFDPARETVQAIGLNWGSEGKYTANVVMSPGGRYLYYLPGAHSHMYQYGTPVVQFDTQTSRKKVIAFLNDFYVDKYGYSPYGGYGLDIDASGESIFFFTNGLFSTKERGSGYGRPAIFQLHIPESERGE